MSLKAFHRVFLVASILCLAFTAVWAAGANAAGLRSPWAFAASLAGAALVAPYFVWHLRSSRRAR
jgi:ABC-type Fe3+-siderophore transport system permease subunit